MSRKLSLWKQKSETSPGIEIGRGKWTDGSHALGRGLLQYQQESGQDYVFVFFSGLKEEYPTASSNKLSLASLCHYQQTLDCTQRWIRQSEKHLRQKWQLSDESTNKLIHHRAVQLQVLKQSTSRRSHLAMLLSIWSKTYCTSASALHLPLLFQQGHQTHTLS